MAWVDQSSTGGQYLKDLSQYGISGDQAYAGMAVPGQPGKVLGHEFVKTGGGGWFLQDAPGTPQRVIDPTPDTAAPAAAPAPAAPPPPAPVAQPGQLANTPAAPGQPATVSSAFRDALMARLQANPAPTAVTEDPALAAQSGAFKQAQARAEARNRSALAERAAATGTLESGAFDAGVQALGADRAFAEGQFDAGLLSDARQQRMQELASWLGIAGNLIGEQDRVALQTELMRLQEEDAAAQRALQARGLDIQERGITTQGELGRSDIGLRTELGRGNLGLGLLGLLLGDRNTRTGQGIQLAGLESGLNTQALLGLLGGGYGG